MPEKRLSLNWRRHKELTMGIWIAGIVCTVFGLLAIYAAKKGWLK